MDSIQFEIRRLLFSESVHENQWNLQQLSCPLVHALAMFFFIPKSNIPEEKKYDKIQYWCNGDILPTQRSMTTAIVTFNNLEKINPSETEGAYTI